MFMKKKIKINDDIVEENISPSQKENETHAEFLLRKWETKMKIYRVVRDAYDSAKQLRQYEY